MLAIKLIAGALIGTALKIACDFIEQRIFVKQEYRTASVETKGLFYI